MKFLDVPRSGSYQGLTSSRNSYGQYVRTRAQPTNPASSFQQAVRSRMALNAQNYRDLTAAQRSGWSDLGAQIIRSDSLGQSYSLKGFNTYCLINNNKLAAGDVTVADAPLYVPPDPMATLTLTATAASLSLAYTPTPVGAAERVFISCSPMRSAGRTFENDFRLLTVTAAAAASPSNILAAYTARFGVPVTGSRIFISAQRYTLGMLSTSIITSAVVA